MSETTKPNIKAAFFDIDGTLIPFGPKGERTVPNDTVAALMALRSRGVALIVCTGRFVRFAKLVEDHFPMDGYATLNGQWCLLGEDDEVVRQVPVNERDKATMLDLFRRGEVVGVVNFADELFVTGTPERLKEVKDRWVMTPHRPIGEIDADRPVYQFVIAAPPEEDARIQALTDHLVTQRWEPTSVDVIQEGGGKRRAMEAYFERLGITADQSIAFGDGANDIPMLETAGIGVAMGNASDEVKAHADFVSDACDAGGIWNALVALGVIEGERVERESVGQEGGVS